MIIRGREYKISDRITIDKYRLSEAAREGGFSLPFIAQAVSDALKAYLHTKPFYKRVPIKIYRWLFFGFTLLYPKDEKGKRVFPFIKLDKGFSASYLIKVLPEAELTRAWLELIKLEDDKKKAMENQYPEILQQEKSQSTTT